MPQRKVGCILSGSEYRWPLESNRKRYKHINILELIEAKLAKLTLHIKERKSVDSLKDGQHSSIEIIVKIGDKEMNS